MTWGLGFRVRWWLGLRPDGRLGKQSSSPGRIEPLNHPKPHIAIGHRLRVLAFRTKCAPRTASEEFSRNTSQQVIFAPSKFVGACVGLSCCSRRVLHIRP